MSSHYNAADSVAATGFRASYDGSAGRHYGWLLAYAVLLIYGCLVPLDFHPQSFDAALARMHEIPMLALGAYSRADWISNGVLFVPLGFLACNALLGQQASSVAKVVATALATLLAITLAWGIEFVQIYFPPRTVSLNDILAECMGGLLGALLALPAHGFLRKLIHSDRYSPSQLRQLTLHALVPLYLCISLFPFDFLVSSAELQNKLASQQWGLLFAGISLQGSHLRLLLSLGAETCVASLIGLYVCTWRPQRTDMLLQAALAGLLVGAAIELLQLFMYSGISQGISVLTRAAGATAGGLLWQHRDRLKIGFVRSQLSRWRLLLWPIWILALIVVNGWFWKQWGSMNEAQLSLEQLHWLPFYYYYYTSENTALVSLLAISAQYSFVALMAWAQRRSAAYAGGMAMLFATPIEVARLFHPNTHADPSNILIAAVSSAFLCWLLSRLTADENTSQEHMASAAAEPALKPPAHTAHSSHSSANASGQNSGTAFAPKPTNKRSLVIALLMVAAVLAWTTTFPIPTLPLAAFFLLALLAVWFQPRLYIPITLIALPVLDLAPWSGRLFFDEFDVLLLSGGVFAWLRSNASGKHVSDPLYRLFLGAFSLSLLISTVIALSQASGIDLNSFSNYLSPFNALRIVRGFAEALFFLAVLRRLGTSNALAPWFAWGMVLGLSIAMAIILMEKRLFGGLFNLASGYRVTGSFSAIHIGGAYIECYLAIACPFLLYLIFHSRKVLVFLGGGILLLVTTYGLMVTYSRNGYSAYAVALLISFCGLLMSRTGKVKKIGLVSLLGAAALAIAMPVFKGAFAQQRISEIGRDLGIRTSHWHDALAMRRSDAVTTLFGMGIGQYPTTHFWQSQEHRTAYPSLMRDASGNISLQITSGNTIYVEQLVDVQPGHIYQLSFDITQHQPGASPGIALCEKWMLASSACANWSTFKPNTDSQHVHYETQLNTQAFSSGGFPSRRPIKLSLFNNGNSTLEFDNVRLMDQGQDLLKNGDFSQGMDHWFFASDDHLPWHAKSLPVAVLFDQGWFGLLTLAAFSSLALLRGTRRLFLGEQLPATYLAAFAAFLVVGIFDTLIDAPRFLFLFTLLACLCARREAPSHRPTHP